MKKRSYEFGEYTIVVPENYIVSRDINNKSMIILDGDSVLKYINFILYLMDNGKIMIEKLNSSVCVIGDKKIEIKKYGE